ncbi:MAG TPA: alanine dehydrogenase [Gammaproteobacteria bacterium]|nr:alanine dehydrogenase [Gammaproteobacteria bacterium]
MEIGVPKEVKPFEGRVGLIPEAVADLVSQGHQIYIETQAGVQSGYEDETYLQAGAEIVPDAKSLYASARLIVKVKEPIAAEYDYLSSQHLLFSFLHLAAVPQLTQVLVDKGLTAVAFETVQEGGRLPLLAPMSEVAGRIAVQAATHYLHSSMGGRGILLGGVAGSERGRVVVLGAGVAGTAAAQLAAQLGAQVTVFDVSHQRLHEIRRLGANVTALHPYQKILNLEIEQADLLVGAVLVPGAKTPHIVTREMVCSMLPGSLIADISVDQGGCIETTRPTSYADPTYVEEGVVHFCVTNMPGAVPRTSSQALSAVITPYVSMLAEPNWRENPVLANAVNVASGKVCLTALQ